MFCVSFCNDNFHPLFDCIVKLAKMIFFFVSKRIYVLGYQENERRQETKIL